MNKKLKKVISTGLICTMLLGTTSAMGLTSAADDSTAVTSTQAKSYKITKKKMWMRTPFPNPLDPTELLKQKITLSFVNGTDIPYMEISDYMDVFKSTFIEPGSEYDLTVTKNGNNVILTRETGYPAIIDFDQDTITFADYNKFTAMPGNTIVEVVPAKMKDAAGKDLYVKSLSGTTERYGKVMVMDLGEYGIDLVQKGDKFYIPLQTINDIFLSPFNSAILYNTKSCYFYNFNIDTFVDQDGITEYGKSYYNANADGKLSPELADFNYRELCFAFDNFYGLKEIHNITSFSQLCYETGFEDDFLSGDSKRIDTALYKIFTRYIDDIHSVYNNPGYESGGALYKTLNLKYGYGRCTSGLIDLIKEFRTERSKFFPDGVPAYQEVGDTAFITFDKFISTTQDYYTTAPTAESADTYGIIAYSVQQILRKDSPVKNVVLDLSCNTGGDTGAAAYTLGAFLGKVSLCTTDMNTEALVCADYASDTNLDGKYNKKDYLAEKGLNLYCLQSGISFSCGNLVPSVFKHDRRVSLIGQTSGGGSCTLGCITTASGSGITISSNRRMSFMKNGSFYDIDLGAEPDYTLSKISSFFDREKLVEYIDSLL